MTVPVPRPGVGWVELDGETVLYEPSRGMVVVLNPTASVLWQCFDGVSSATEIAEDVADIWQRDAASVQADIEALIAQLRESGHLDPDA